MNVHKHNNTSQLNYHYGLALEEIKLERTLNSMAFLLDGFDDEDRPQYLVNEIAHQKKQLKSLRDLRSVKE